MIVNYDEDASWRYLLWGFCGRLLGEVSSVRQNLFSLLRTQLSPLPVIVLPLKAFTLKVTEKCVSEESRGKHSFSGICT